MCGSSDVVVEKNQRVGNTMSNLRNLGQMAQDGNNIYFSLFEPDNYTRLFRIDLNGNNRTLIVEYLTINRFEEEPPEFPYGINFPEGIFNVHMPTDLIRGINVIGDWVYYIGANRRIYKVGVDGENNQRLTDIEATRLIVYDDMIYFTCSYQRLHTMDTNGENMRLLYGNTVRRIIFYDEYIFINRYGLIFRIDLNGDNLRLVFMSDHISTSTRSVYDFHIYNNKIFIELDNKIYSMTMYGGDITEVGRVNRTSGEASNFYRNYFFYISREQGFLGIERRVFRQINLDTGNIIRRNINHNPVTLHVINNRIFFNTIGGLHSMNFDGSNLRRFR